MTRRYEDWTHVRVNGDRHAAAPYLGEARKLLGAVMEEAARNGLGVHALHRRLNDGTVIIAEKHGDIPRITITPAPRPGGQPEPLPDDFVVWARDATRPDGIDDEHPQQIVRRWKSGDWSTYFYSGQIDGHDEFRGAKGTYLLQFPEGIPRAGNVDWVGKRGERLSWYGPSNGVACDPYVKSRRQFGKFVFHLGRPLLDVDAYQGASAPDAASNYPHILGACLRSNDDGRHLYTIQTYMPDTGDTVPWEVQPRTASVTDPLVAATNQTFLCRYAVVGAGTDWTVRANSREVVATWNLPRMQQPWRFSRDGALATATAPAGAAREVVVWEDSGFESAPPTACAVYTVNVDTGALTTSSVGVADSFVPLIRDWDMDGQALALEAGWTAIDGERWPALRFDGVELPVAWDAVAADGTLRRLSARQHKLLYASVRDRVYVVLRYDYTGQVELWSANGSEGWASTIEVYRKGVLVATLATQSAHGGPVVLSLLPFEFESVAGAYTKVSRKARFMADALSTVTFSPMHLLYGVWLTGRVDTAEVSLPLDLSFFGSLFGRMPWPSAHCFGGYRKNTSDVPMPALLVSGGSLAGFDTDRVDFDGMPNILGCATIDDTTILSGPGFSGHFSESMPVEITGEATHHVDHNDLRTLTGVGGAQARYHPVWVLGKPIDGVQ